MNAAAASWRRPRGRARVLVVDDDEQIRDAVGELLADEGFTFETAVDGEDALEQLITATTPPDVILLDLMMPRRNGYELLDVLRASVTLVDVPVIVLSAHISSPPLGAVAWLRKPFKSEELIATIERVTSSGPAAA